MRELANIARVESRMATIRSRFAAGGASSSLWTPSTEVTGPADPTVGFDPFGAAYQQALAASGGGGVTAAAAFAPASGVNVERVAVTTRPTVGAIGGVSSGASGSRSGAAPNSNPVADASTFAATPTGVSVGQIGGFGTMPVPPDLGGYGNGRVPTSSLAPIGQGSHKLWGPAANAWQQLVSAAAADGISMSITDSYRSYDQQVDLADRKGLYQNGGYAAVPGKSNHGWGVAVDADVSDPAALDWMRTNAWRFGFVEAVKREPWHWEFRPSQA